MTPDLSSNPTPPATPGEAKFGPQSAPDDPRIFKGPPSEFFGSAANALKDSDEVLVILEEQGAARRELGEALRRERDPLDAKLLGERTAEAQLRDLEAAAQNHPYVSQVQEAVRVSWWPEQRYASGQPPRPATFTYHKRTRRGGHYVVAITRDEALALLEGGAA